MQNKGMMFAFCGIDGSGKTSTLAMVAERLREKGFDVLETCEPTKTEFGMKIRNLLFESGDISKGAEFFLFLADRCEHIEKVINPALEAGKIVLCDRFVYSTAVYQEIVDEEKCLLGETELKFNSLELSAIKLDVNLLRHILLDCPADIAFNRLQKRGSLNRYDNVSIERLAKIRNDYLGLKDSDCFHFCINAELPQARTVNSIVSYIESEIAQDIFKRAEKGTL